LYCEEEKIYGNLLKHLRLNHESEYGTLQVEEAAQIKEKEKPVVPDNARQ